MKVHLVRPDTRDGRYHVWVSLDETLTRELPNAGESFIIASGPTKALAILQARKVLARAADSLGRYQQ